MFANAIDFVKDNVSKLKDLKTENNEEEITEIPIQEETKTPMLKTIFDELNIDQISIRSFREMVDKSTFHYPIEKLSDRIYNNIQYYSANYILILLLLFSYICIVNPLFLIFTSCSLFIYHKNYNTQVLGVSIMCTILMGGTKLIILCLFGGGFIIFHSIMKISPYIPNIQKEKSN